MKKIFILLILLSFISVITFANGESDESETIVFGDLSWTSVTVHNRIAAFIMENGLGNYQAEFTAADTLVTMNAMIQGDIDVNMESWHSNFQEVYDKGTASGDIVDLGKNMPDAPQAWWIPRYVVEGSNAPAPDLKSISDLPRYAELFTDPEDPKKGVIYGGVSGWAQLQRGEQFFEEYGLEDTFNLSSAGSGAALAATMVGAYEKKEPWVGYYWAPTAVMGRLDMVMLKGTEYPPANVNILVYKSMLERAPDVVDFLKNYSTTIDDNNQFLAKMEAEEWDAQETAIWFLQNKEEVWTQWVSGEVASKVKKALSEL